MKQSNLAFIGAGNMASSLIAGLVSNGYPSHKIIASAPILKKLKILKEKFNIQVTTDNTAACAQGDILVFAVKPGVVKIVAEELAGLIKNKLVISIAAGIRINHIEQWAGAKIAVVRCMPNTPALIGNGATGLFASHNVTEDHRNQAESIMRTVGVTAWVKQEADLDTVTALSGAGPAYFFLVMDALVTGAIKLGLDEKTAKLLTLQTALGAARIALESEEALAQLIQRVASPGGATERALDVFTENNLTEIFFSALTAAKKRAEQLGE